MSAIREPSTGMAGPEGPGQEGGNRPNMTGLTQGEEGEVGGGGRAGERELTNNPIVKTEQLFTNNTL